MKLPSSDLGSSHLLRLAQRVLHHQADPDVDSVVVTRGNDTMEETALFHALDIPPGKPAVLAGAMRPGGALSADGPRNLLSAARVAGDPAAMAHGVLVVTDDQIVAASPASKRHTMAVGAFEPEGEGLRGEIPSDRATFLPGGAAPSPRFDAAAPATPPRSEILRCH